MSFKDYMGTTSPGAVGAPAESQSVELGFASANVRTSVEGNHRASLIENDRCAPSLPVGTDDNQQVISFEEFIADPPVESQSIELGFAPTSVQNSMKGRSRVSPDGNQVISLEAFVVGPSRKRACVNDVLNSDDEHPEPKKTTKARRARGTRAVRALREIIGREGMGPIDYKQLAEKIQVPVNLLDLFQMSPDLSKAFRKLSTQVNVKKSKSKTAIAAVESVESASSIPTGSSSVSRNVHNVSATSSLVLSQPLMPRLRSDEKAFRVPAVVKTQRSGDVIRQISLPAGTVQADQGSELNLISIGLVKAMHYKPLSLSSKGFSGLTMNTADGGSSALTHFVTFWLSVLGIWRKVNAFIHPYDREAAPKDPQLLLGLPWLESVDAKIGVRDCRIEIW